MLDHANRRPIEAAPRSFLANLLADTSLNAHRQAFRDDATLFEADDPATALFGVHRGQVRLYQDGPSGGTRLVEIAGPEDVFGTAALSDEPTFGVRAVTAGPTVVSRVPAEDLLASLARRPVMLLELTRRLAGKLETARQETADLIFRDCNDRLVRALVRLSRSPAATATADGTVMLRLTHQQLAWSVGVARETVSLALTDLRKHGLVTTGRNRVSFNPARLAEGSRGR
ncbi:MAG: Crp/Fnr family transcriptional regulator [Phycisphaerae bacterium]